MLRGRVRSKPGRAITRSGRNFLPHHEPMIRSGSRAITSSIVTTRSLAAPWLARSPKMSVPPAMAMRCETHPIPEISSAISDGGVRVL